MTNDYQRGYAERVMTEARDMALASAKQSNDAGTEDEFLRIAQKLDEVLRPGLMAEIRRRPSSADLDADAAERKIQEQTK